MTRQSDREKAKKGVHIVHSKRRWRRILSLQVRSPRRRRSEAAQVTSSCLSRAPVTSQRPNHKPTNLQIQTSSLDSFTTKTMDLALLTIQPNSQEQDCANAQVPTSKPKTRTRDTSSNSKTVALHNLGHSLIHEIRERKARQKRGSASQPDTEG